MNAVKKITNRMCAIFTAAIAVVTSTIAIAAEATVTAPSSAALVAGLGSSTTGSETGIYEIVGAVTAGLAVVFGLVITVVGYKVVISIVRKVGMKRA